MTNGEIRENTNIIITIVKTGYELKANFSTTIEIGKNEKDSGDEFEHCIDAYQNDHEYFYLVVWH